MCEKLMYWLSVLFSLVALGCLITSSTIISHNRALQEEIGKRQASISMAASLTQLNQNLAQSLADIAVSKDDKLVRDLLASQGITVHRNDQKTGETPATPAAAAKKISK